MAHSELNNPLLRRYWLEAKDGLGFGVTAFSVGDAKGLLAEENIRAGRDYELVRILEDVDIRDLDQNHVIPNMGPINFRGVWYPNLTIHRG